MKLVEASPEPKESPRTPPKGFLGMILARRDRTGERAPNKARTEANNATASSAIGFVRDVWDVEAQKANLAPGQRMSRRVTMHDGFVVGLSGYKFEVPDNEQGKAREGYELRIDYYDRIRDLTLIVGSESGSLVRPELNLFVDGVDVNDFSVKKARGALEQTSLLLTNIQMAVSAGRIQDAPHPLTEAA
jgi:hypothetical protein